jgi:hypothetical protein
MPESTALLERVAVPVPAARYASLRDAPKAIATRCDGCPNCLIRDNVPQLWAITGETLVCVYQCTRCRHAWWTGWSAPSLEIDAISEAETD